MSIIEEFSAQANNNSFTLSECSNYFKYSGYAYSELDAMKVNPNDAAAFYNRGVAHARRGYYDSAIQDYNEAIRLNPNDAQAFNNRGNAYANKGQLDRAIEDFNQAIRLDPNNSQVFYNRGCAYTDKGLQDRAIEDYDEAIRLNPNFARAFYNRGVARWNSRQSDRAIQDFNEAIRLDPRDAQAFNNRGVARLKSGDITSGSADIARASQLAKDEEKRTLLPLWILLFATSVAINAYIWNPSTLSALAIFGMIVVVFRVCVTAISRQAASRTISMEHGGSESSLLAMLLPICAIVWISGHVDGSLSAMLSSGLSELGYTLGAAAVVAGHFNILGLHNRKITLCAAIAFFVVGTVISNLFISVGGSLLIPKPIITIFVWSVMGQQ